jgi:hypothetical protein
VDLYAEPISDLEVQAILHEPRLKASILVEEANDRARI